jgi:glucosamine 6-phosphate synthetase-like amidotransferase/phosphosugar isomerase protein
MCCLCGWWKPEFPAGCNRETLLKHLIRKGQPYGDRSVGIATDLPGKDALVKYPGLPSQWLAQSSKDIPRYAKATVILGHTRLPTAGCGVVAPRNTHPFKIGRWVSCHNGVIHGADQLMLRSEYIPKGETDSEAAICWLATNEFRKKAFEDLDGSFAIAAMTKDASMFVLAVDAVTSLHVAWLGSGIVWHKSGEALESSLKAAGIQAAVKPLQSKILRLPGPEVEELEIPTPRPPAWPVAERGATLWSQGPDEF